MAKTEPTGNRATHRVWSNSKMTTDRITANLPSRDFEITEAFYVSLGFVTDFRSDAWMILRRDKMIIEFFPHPELDPEESWFSASMRLQSIDELYAEWTASGLVEGGETLPRLGAPFTMDGAPRMFTLHDPDGSLWRVLEMG